MAIGHLLFFDSLHFISLTNKVDVAQLVKPEVEDGGGDQGKVILCKPSVGALNSSREPAQDPPVNGRLTPKQLYYVCTCTRGGMGERVEGGRKGGREEREGEKEKEKEKERERGRTKLICFDLQTYICTYCMYMYAHKIIINGSIQIRIIVHMYMYIAIRIKPCLHYTFKLVPKPLEVEPTCIRWIEPSQLQSRSVVFTHQFQAALGTSLKVYM